MSSFSRRTMYKALSVIGAAALSISLTSGAQATTPTSTPTATPTPTATVVPAPNKTITTQSVGMQMFMWPWTSLKTECTNYLGPNHIDWIMVSPPQEDVSGYQWWVHYQPVSYQLNSQLGTAQQFADMVNACNTAGVQVIVDAVINHMANSSGVGFSGTSFDKYSYPGLYNTNDFHAGLNYKDPNFCGGDISNYDAVWEATHCELGGLPDLATEKSNVRATIAGYLNHLIDLGVAGFRIDAAKHIGLTDLTAIHGMLKKVNGKTPYFLQEVIGSASANAPWTANGDVFAWDYQSQFANILSGQTGLARPTNARQQLIGDANSTIIMVSNHDTEHHGPTAITYLDPQKYLTASAFLLADSFGKPMLYTGYAFNVGDLDAGAPIDIKGYEKPAVCPSATASLVPQKTYKVGTFICMDRWKAIAGMTQWHHEVGTSPIIDVTYSNQILSFNRGTGFFIMSGYQQLTQVNITTTVQTGLAAGTYCDVVSGGAVAIKAGKCVGGSVVVAANGTAKIKVNAMTAIAIDAANKLK